MGSGNQEASMLNYAESEFIKKHGMSEEEFDKLKINPKSILILAYIRSIFINQQKNLKQFGINPYSRFLQFQKSNKLNQRFSYEAIDYIIFKNDKRKEFKNIRLYDFPKTLINDDPRKVPLNKKIPTNNKGEFIMITSIYEMFSTDLKNDISIISIPGANIDEIKLLCDSCIHFSTIESEIKKLYSNAEFQKKSILSSSEEASDIQLLDALQQYNGKFVFQQENKVLVFLHNFAVDVNYKSPKQELKENTPSFDFFILCIKELTKYINIKFI